MARSIILSICAHGTHGAQVGELDTVTAVAFQKKRLCTHFDRNSGEEECKRKVERGGG